jgi:hypothetical protein
MPARYIIMSTLPQCQFCDSVAQYDFRTKDSRWTYACEEHWRRMRAAEGLGIGEGQLLVRESDIRTYIKRTQDKQISIQIEGA